MKFKPVYPGKINSFNNILNFSHIMSNKYHLLMPEKFLVLMSFVFKGLVKFPINFEVLASLSTVLKNRMPPFRA